MEIEFNAQTEQFVTKEQSYFSCSAPELTFEQVEEIKTAIMMDQTYQHEDISGLTYYFSYEEIHSGRKSGKKSWDVVRMTIVNGELKISGKFIQDSFFEALDEIAEHYNDAEEEQEEDEYLEEDAELEEMYESEEEY
jgi:hypothetical protein